MRTIRAATMLAIVLFFGLTILSASGCGVAFQLLGAWRGNERPPKYAGLKGKRVAVICFDANNLRGPNNDPEVIAKTVSTLLGHKIKDIKLVNQQEIADWIDTREQTVDYREIGRGVKADMVLGIDLRSFTIHEPGGSLLQGRAEVEYRVYDLSKPNEPVYGPVVERIRFPEHSPRPITDNEGNFRYIFSDTVAKRIARDFFPFDHMDDWGKDASFID